MALFDKTSLEHLKKLCRIECTPEEEMDLLESLQKVLAYMEQLQEVDTEKVKPCNYVLRGMLQNQMRGDEVGALLPREEFLANAPEHIGGMIRTPPVLKVP